MIDPDRGSHDPRISVDHDLLETLRLAQRLGVVGSGSVIDAAEHALQYVEALAPVPAGSRLVDLGSGGGLPALVVGRSRPDLELLLIDRRQKRADFLARAVARLGLDGTVRCDDVRRLVDDVDSGSVRAFDAVTARSFGPPSPTMRVARSLLTPGGCFVVSEPPSGDRWDPELLAELGAERVRCGGVSRFTFAS